MVKGYIHSIETMGLVDGPGIRVVVFMQGCYLRCAFCHNPDTWIPNQNLEVTPQQIVDRVRKFRPYMEESGGGVTFSGGDPLFQSEFLLETLRLCKKAGINTCLDTAGTGYKEELLEDIFKWTDLIILDVKAIDPVKYQELTTRTIDQFNRFLELSQKYDKKLWIRQVIVPGLNDTKEYIVELKEYIKNIKNVERVELLPYNVLGVDKYKKLDINYRLDGVEPLSQDKLEELNKILYQD